MTHYSTYPGVLQFEISSVCNAQCPGCVRTVLDYTSPTDNITIENLKVKSHPDIPKNMYMSLDIFKSVFNERTLKELKNVEFIGTIDDPLAHPEFLDMLRFLVDTLNEETMIVIHTNASLRTPDVFREMAAILTHHKHRVCFNIDGLADTNHLYRRNTNFDKIIENAKAFIEYHRRSWATWQYLVFPWNAHQVEAAEELSKELGFKEFVHRNDRALSDRSFEKIVNEQNKKTEYKKYLKVFDSKAAASPISCVMQPRSMYFINYEGTVWPCCFLNNMKYSKMGKYEESWERFENNYEGGWNNLHHYTIDEILDHPFYTEDLVDSWSSTTHGTGCKDRILKCTATCTKKQLEIIPMSDHKKVMWTSS